VRGGTRNRWIHSTKKDLQIRGIIAVTESRMNRNLIVRVIKGFRSDASGTMALPYNGWEMLRRDGVRTAA
jgi:hypothetical protein